MALHKSTDKTFEKVVILKQELFHLTALWEKCNRYFLRFEQAKRARKISVFISHKRQFRVKSRDSRTFSRNSREK